LFERDPNNCNIYLTVPDVNKYAINFFKEMNLKEVFRVKRMYKGIMPKENTDLEFGVCCIELTF
jgi:hypothetical protein